MRNRLLEIAGLEESKTLLDTTNYIEPEQLEKVLEQIYHILSGNQRDYESINGLDELIKCLKKYDTTNYN